MCCMCAKSCMGSLVLKIVGDYKFVVVAEWAIKSSKESSACWSLGVRHQQIRSARRIGWPT